MSSKSINWVAAGSLLAATPAVLAGLPQISLAQEDDQPTPAIANFLALVADGNIEAARPLIARVESISGDARRDFLTTDRDEILRLIAGCPAVSYSTSGSEIFRIETVELDCEGGRLELQLVGEVEASNPYVNIVGLRDEAMREAAAAAPRLPRIPPPAPPAAPRAGSASSPEEVRAAVERTRALEAERLRIANVLGEAVQNGDLSTVAQYFTPTTRFVFQTRDPFFGADIVERQGTGLAEGQAQVDQARAELGEVASYECSKGEGNFSPYMCRWTLDDPESRMFAMVFFSGERVQNLVTYYITRELVEDFARQAAERGVDVEAVLSGNR